MLKEGKIKRRGDINGLLKEARGGNDSAFSELLEIYEPLLLSMVAKYSLEYGESDDKEDLLQDLRVAFYKAVRGYDSDRSTVEFGLYARICPKNALISRYRLKKGHSVEILPIEDAVGIYSTEHPGDGVIENESFQAVQSLINSNLSDYEKSVWNLYLDGDSPKQIAKRLGKDAKSISNALSRIRAKLRALIDENNI